MFEFLLSYEVLLPLLVIFTRSGLLFMCALALLRFVSPSLDSTLKYGKLRTPDVSALSINNVLAWRSYYLISLVFTVGLYSFLAAIERFNPSWTMTLFAVTFSLHLLRRIYETLFVQKLSDYPMSIFLYLLGVAYYIAVPFASLVELQDLFEFHGGDRTFSLSSENLLWTLSGLLVFIVGSYLQYHSHVVLASLRATPSESKTTKVARTFSIPRGGLFDLVSCPHYFGELVIYFSFLLITHFSIINLWLVFVFVAATMFLTASETHEWYQKKFDDYPKSRKRLIPFFY